jgi:DNA polymerase/3'-5' exonuclease PolX
MSDQAKKMHYDEALPIALDVFNQLKPHCVRTKIKIAGSLRRERAIIGDIEIVCIPLPYEIGLFMSGIATVINQWPKVKGELEYGKCKYTKRILPCGMNVDIFFPEIENWGNILLIRTGDWEFSKKFMGSLLPQRGYKQEDGFLKYKNKIIPCYEEMDLFRKVGLEYIEPRDRTVNAI